MTPPERYGERWERRELLIAQDLEERFIYMTGGKLPGGQNRLIVRIAPFLGRSAASLSRKITNIGRFDPEWGHTTVRRDRDSESIMEERLENPVAIREAAQEEYVRLGIDVSDLPPLPPLTEDYGQLNQPMPISPDGIPAPMKLTIVIPRWGQSKFRRAVLNAYDGRCAVTGLRSPHRLLNAAHIRPWSESDWRERLSAQNGLSLGVNYHAAFDAGFITVTKRMTWAVSPKLALAYPDLYQQQFRPYDGASVILPNDNHLWPGQDELTWHRNHVFEIQAGMSLRP